MKTKKFSVKFYPREEKTTKHGQIPIYCRIIAGKKIELSTTKLISKGDWNEKTQRVRSSNNDADTINTYLDSFQSKVLAAHTRLFVDQQPLTADKLKAAIFGIVAHEKTLLEVVIEHNSMFEKRIGKGYSYGSFKNYKTTRKYLEAFVLYKYKRKDIALSLVNYGFCDSYFTYLTTEKPCNVNGANKHIQRLKALINYAIKMGYIEKNPLLSYSLKFEPFQQYKLSWDEIERLKALELGNNTMQQVLDVFVFQCYTGLAYADVKELSQKHIVELMEVKWILMLRTKTKKDFAVPIFKPAQLILDKYDTTEDDPERRMLPVISNQKMNAYLKIIADVAKIPYPLSCHVARHTFSTTVTLLEGVPMETVSKMLGHSKITMTQTYSVVTMLKISKDIKGLKEKLEL